MRTKLKRVLSLVLFGLGFCCGHTGRQKILYRGGPIPTMDDQDRVVSALLLEGSRIVAVGTEQELQQRAPDAEIRDLHGHARFRASSTHTDTFRGAGLDEIMVDVAPATWRHPQHHGADRAIERPRKEKSGNDWVVGQRYDDTLLAEHRHPTRQDLDQYRPHCRWWPFTYQGIASSQTASFCADFRLAKRQQIQRAERSNGMQMVNQPDCWKRPRQTWSSKQSRTERDPGTDDCPSSQPSVCSP